MYWKYNSPSSAQIDTLLQKEDVTLQELMEAEELLQECKGQNKKVVEFLTKPNILEELVCMVVEEPPLEKELQVRFKPANLASELLTCDVPAIIDNLASSNLLVILYRFLEREKPLNPLMASFVSKVFGMLIVRRTEQNWYTYQWICFQVLEFFKSKENFVELAVRHIGTSAIMDLLSKLICGVNNDDHPIKSRIHTWLNECQLIEKLLEKLTPDCDSEEHSSVDQLLCELTYSCRESPSNGKESLQNGSKSSLLSTLESEIIVNKLLDILLHENRNESSVSHVINILLTLLSNKNVNHQSHFQHIQSIDFVSDIIDNRSVVRTILQRLPDILQILLIPSKLGPLITSYGKEVERLGSMRLQVINLIVCLIATNDLIVHTKLAELSALKILLDLFFKFSLNNFLHTQVTQCIVCVLKNQLTSGEDVPSKPAVTEVAPKKDAQIDGLNNNNPKSDDDAPQSAGKAGPPSQVEEMQVQCAAEPASDAGQANGTGPTDEGPEAPTAPTSPLLVQLFTQCRIIEKLLANFCQEEDSSVIDKKVHNMCGFMGHLREIANTIVACIENGPNSNLIKQHIQSLPENFQTEWEDFALITLAEVNLKNKVIPIQSCHHSIDDSEDDIYTISDTENLVITNQGYRDSEIDVISDFRSGAAFDDFKDTMENIRHMSLAASDSGGVLSISRDIDFDTENSNMENTELFEQLCSQKFCSNEDFEEMWKFEKKITFASSELSDIKDDSAENADSSPEEDPNIDDEFDMLRTTTKASQQQEEMDVDDIPDDEWSEVFDKRGSSGSIESFNPWENAPASDTSDHNNWASFSSPSLGGDNFSTLGNTAGKGQGQGAPISFEAFGSSALEDGSQQKQQDFFPLFPQESSMQSSSTAPQSTFSDFESCGANAKAAQLDFDTHVDNTPECIDTRNVSESRAEKRVEDDAANAASTDEPLSSETMQCDTSKEDGTDARDGTSASPTESQSLDKKGCSKEEQPAVSPQSSSIPSADA